MFKLIYEMLQLQPMYGISKDIDVVKGINKYPTTIKESFQNAKRKILTK
ncbi:MAG: hypothetical protein V4572_12070 [Bacteroidota bacterium]